ncbi:hypothetical protein TNCT_166531 [Trichonephila clavata]|uniref:Uncharacterized protein n=1 Tax=Trichonephila clavata TaxID=2740835 RepID=A0A8X6IPJ9_TRICU|nr:hypothetical protein TNCT_166531 [Trichonephila clavata]
MSLPMSNHARKLTKSIACHFVMRRKYFKYCVNEVSALLQIGYAAFSMLLVSVDLNVWRKIFDFLYDRLIIVFHASFRKYAILMKKHKDEKKFFMVRSFCQFRGGICLYKSEEDLEHYSMMTCPFFWKIRQTFRGRNVLQETNSEKLGKEDKFGVYFFPMPEWQGAWARRKVIQEPSGDMMRSSPDLVLQPFENDRESSFKTGEIAHILLKYPSNFSLGMEHQAVCSSVLCSVAVYVIGLRVTSFSLLVVAPLEPGNGGTIGVSPNSLKTIGTKTFQPLLPSHLHHPTSHSALPAASSVTPAPEAPLKDPEEIKLSPFQKKWIETFTTYSIEVLESQGEVFTKALFLS